MAGMELNMKIPDSLSKALKAFEKGEANDIINKALKAAAAPAKRYLRNEVRLLRNVSEQSSGATHRSMITKVSFPSRSMPGYGYLYVGVDRRYEEHQMKNTPQRSAAVLARNKRSSVRKDRIIAFTNKNRRQTGRRPPTKRFIKSHQKSPLRKSKGANSQHNVPNKIWHWLEDGFTHRSGTRFKGYNFRKNAAAATAETSIKAFEDSLSRGLTRILGGK